MKEQNIDLKPSTAILQLYEKLKVWKKEMKIC